jgi:phosphate transport system substrate-binding protein
VSYSGGGSGAGRTAFTGGTTNFAGTDSKYGSTDTPPADYTYVPIIAGPVSIMFRNDGYSGTLKLSATTIAKIFAGTITDWDHADIAADNGSALASKTIKVVYRSDSSGTSSGFTEYLKAAAPTVWTKAASSTFVSSAPNGAPAGSQGKSGSDGVASYVRITDGSISYAELSYQLESADDGVKSISVKNASGSFVKPSAASATAAASAIPAANFDEATGWVKADYLTTVATAYPITIYSFGIAHKSYSKENDVVKDFLSYSLNSCAETEATSLGYSKLTSTALTFAKARVALVSSVNRPASATTTVAPTVAKKASVKVNRTISAKTVAVGGKLAVARTAKVTLRVTSGSANCRVVGATLKGVKKGTCKVLASVKTGTKTKTATVTVTVS